MSLAASLGAPATLFVVVQAAELRAAPSACAATAMLADARTRVPATNDALRARLDDIGEDADAAERARNVRDRRWYCMRALLAFADLAPGALGPERGEKEATRARQLAVELSTANGPYTGPQVPPPAPTPISKWERRRRVLVGHAAASGVFTGIGLLLVVVPWASLAVCTARAPYPYHFCGEGYGAITLSGIGAPIFVSSVIPLGIWSFRLHGHMQARPPGIVVLGGRARVQLAGPAIRLDF